MLLRQLLPRTCSVRQQARRPRAVAQLAAPVALAPSVEWEGLVAWRRGVNEARAWSSNGAGAPCEAKTVATVAGDTLPGSLAEFGRLVLLTREPERKAALTHAAFAAWCAGGLPLGSAEAPATPGRPERPLLVPMQQTPTPERSPLPLSAHLLHQLTHIELNAVDLAWDTVVRFSGLPMPRGFFCDFARVADDESRHLLWCLQRLSELGHEYGALPSHNQLWEAASASTGDVLVRLAVVPCLQEARGLDAGPKLAEKLLGAGDARSAAVVKRIAAEEQAHVAVGVSWLRAVADARSVAPADAFQKAVAEYYPAGAKGPFNHHARQKVGLPQSWYAPELAMDQLHARLQRVVEREQSAQHQ